MNNDFVKSLDKISNNIEQKRKQVLNEESTKLAFVLPFIKALGYDYSNPNDVIPEYSADIGNKNMDKVDFAIMSNGKPIFFIECKHSGVDNLMNHHGQLAKYFASTPAAKFAILTNGIKYIFFTDMEKEHLLDHVPFLEVDLSDIKEEQARFLELFCKDIFNSDEIIKTVIESKNKKLVLDTLRKELTNPSDDFIRFIIEPFYSEKKNIQTIDKFRPYVREAIAELIPETPAYSSAFIDTVKKIIEEAGHQTKTFRGKIKRDYFYASYKNCEICKFCYDKHGLNVQSIEFYNLYKDQDYKWTKREIIEVYPISSVNDILKYKDRIIATAIDIDESYQIQSLRRKENNNG